LQCQVHSCTVMCQIMKYEKKIVSLYFFRYNLINSWSTDMVMPIFFLMIISYRIASELKRKKNLPIHCSRFFFSNSDSYTDIENLKVWYFFDWCVRKIGLEKYFYLRGTNVYSVLYISFLPEMISMNSKKRNRKILSSNCII